jgi:hypothetical protein
MKSAHRHELQTNALAQRLDVAVQRFRPYVSTAAWVVLGIAVAILVWSYMSKASASRKGDAWNAYNQIIGSTSPNLDELHQSAQEYPGTKMQELAELTWADGQVFNAARTYIYNRRAATDALNRATSAYQGILQTSDDERLSDRAHLGLARVYEMRNELEKARQEYLAIRGGYSEYAKAQADRLSKPEAKETYAWLEKAVPPRVQPPAGAGAPGQRPPFEASELSLPESAAPAPTGPSAAPATSIDDLLEGLGDLPKTDTAPGSEPLPGAEKALPATGETPKADESKSDATAPPATDGATTESATPPESGAAPAADPSAAPPRDRIEYVEQHGRKVC